jgi:germination protein M
VRSVTVDGPVATVDFDAGVLTASVGAEAEAYGIQSVVYTLTGLPQVEKVRFTVEGRDSGTASNGRSIRDWWGHVGLSGQPFTRDPTLRIFDASGT